MNLSNNCPNFKTPPLLIKITIIFLLSVMITVKTSLLPIIIITTTAHLAIIRIIIIGTLDDAITIMIAIIMITPLLITITPRLIIIMLSPLTVIILPHLVIMFPPIQKWVQASSMRTESVPVIPASVVPPLQIFKFPPSLHYTHISESPYLILLWYRFKLKTLTQIPKK